jgi:hypothetical protein
VENGGSHTLPQSREPRMAKRKPSRRPPQAQHCGKSKPSQHDKRARLASPNDQRRRTTEASVPLSGGIATLATAMSRLLDSRIAFRLPIIACRCDVGERSPHCGKLVSLRHCSPPSWSVFEPESPGFTSLIRLPTKPRVNVKARKPPTTAGPRIDTDCVPD